MKKKLRNVLLVLAAYILLLFLLVLVESRSQDASITSLPLALWYSLVTMTTVGYGDLYPVTLAGKLIGVLFLLLSAGALTALITFAVTLFTGKGLPRLRLKRIRNKKVYLFEGDSAAARALAEQLIGSDPAALCIFAGCVSDAPDGVLAVPLSVPEVLSILRHDLKRPTVLYLGPDAEAGLARDDIPSGADLVAETEHVPAALRDGQRYFNFSELCAAMYWQKNPLDAQEKTILLVGFDKLGRALLEYALENCVFSPVRAAEYHVFGSDPQFLFDHPCLKDTVSIGRADMGIDSLIFHDGPFNADESLLSRADRIIFCSDSEQSNLSGFDRLTTYFPFSGKVSVYSPAARGDDVPRFGTVEEVYTPEAVLREGLSVLAREMHAIYRAESGGSAHAWEELSPFLRRSNYASAQHLYEKVRFLLDDHTLTAFSPEQFRAAYEIYLSRRGKEPDLFRRIEHDRWVRFHSMYNWRYSEKRDNAVRRHPLMVPFDELSPAEQAKDDYAWELIGKLAARISKN